MSTSLEGHYQRLFIDPMGEINFIPRLKEQVEHFKMNLCAYSASMNMFFIAVHDQIHVYAYHQPCPPLSMPPMIKNLANPIEILRLQNDQGTILHAVINAIKLGHLGDQEILVVVTDAGTIHLWSMPSLNRASLYLENGNVSTWGIAMAPMRCLLAVSANSHTISLFDLASTDLKQESLRLAPSLFHLNEPRVLSGHTHNIPSLDFNASETHLVSASIDGTFRIWHVHDRSECVCIGSIGQDAWVWTVKFIRKEQVKKVHSLESLLKDFRDIFVNSQNTALSRDILSPSHKSYWMYRNIMDALDEFQFERPMPFPIIHELRELVCFLDEFYDHVDQLRPDTSSTLLMLPRPQHPSLAGSTPSSLTLAMAQVAPTERMNLNTFPSSDVNDSMIESDLGSEPRSMSQTSLGSSLSFVSRPSLSALNAESERHDSSSLDEDESIMLVTQIVEDSVDSYDLTLESSDLDNSSSSFNLLSEPLSSSTLLDPFRLQDDHDDHDRDGDGKKTLESQRLIDSLLITTDHDLYVYDRMSVDTSHRMDLSTSYMSMLHLVATLPGPFYAQYERLNMSLWIPTLSLLVVGSQCGHVVLFRLLHCLKRKSNTDYRLVIEAVLPFSLPPDYGLLIGMFSVPVESHPSSMMSGCRSTIVLHLLYDSGHLVPFRIYAPEIESSIDSIII